MTISRNLSTQPILGKTKSAQTNPLATHLRTEFLELRQCHLVVLFINLAPVRRRDKYLKEKFSLSYFTMLGDRLFIKTFSCPLSCLISRTVFIHILSYIWQQVEFCSDCTYSQSQVSSLTALGIYQETCSLNLKSLLFPQKTEISMLLFYSYKTLRHKEIFYLSIYLLIGVETDLNP